MPYVPRTVAPQEAVAHAPCYGIYADSADRVQSWCKEFGKVLRRDIRRGDYSGRTRLPAWAVRTPA